MTKFEKIIKLAKEPSTFAGLAAAMGGVGIFGMSEDAWIQVFGAIAAVAGVVAFSVLDPADNRDD